MARERLGDLEGALHDLTAALDLQPGANRLLLIRSRLFRRLGRDSDGRDDFREALRVVPTTVEDWVSRALAQLPRNPQQALNDLRQAEQLEPTSVLVQQNLAHVLSEHLEDTDAAINALTAVIEQQPFHEMARGGRCVLYARKQMKKEAMEDIDYLKAHMPAPMSATVYQMGCAHALLTPLHEESRTAAFRLLARALGLGYGTDLLDTDTDLDNIRDSKEFESLRLMATLKNP